MQQDDVESLRSDRESLKEKLSLLIIGRSSSSSIIIIIIIVIIVVVTPCTVG